MDAVSPLQPGPHAAWCTSHPLDPHDPGYDGACFSGTLELDFGERHASPDAVDLAVLFLTRASEGTRLNLIAGLTSISLDRDQIRPLAMALLAYDAIADGDQMAGFYTAEALRGTVGV